MGEVMAAIHNRQGAAAEATLPFPSDAKLLKTSRA
jgi:hypothetical protein